jgi:transposase
MEQTASSSSTARPVELPPGECAAFIGLDWGDKQHAIALWAPGAAKIETSEIEHSAESFHRWLDQLKERFGGRRVAVAVEASKGAVICALLEHPWLLIYPVHPATSRRFSMAFTPSGAKDDIPDALTLLEILRSHRERLRLLLPHDSGTRRIGLLVEARRTMIDRRTMLSNQLTSLLKGYFPQALQLTGDKRYAPLALAFLERWPELAALQKARPETVRRFYYTHHVRQPESVEARLELIRAARALTTDRALCEVSIIELKLLLAEITIIQKHIAALEETIAAIFAAHPDADLFRSLPGAGAAMAPRLSVLFGTDRERWSNAMELQIYYGIAPVTERTGGKPKGQSKSRAESKKWVHWRWNAPCFARQTLVEWAGVSIKFSPWARAYYQQQKDRQKGHAAILRSLAFKWLRILWRCWKTRTLYNEAIYLAQLQKRSPKLFDLIQPT